MHGAGGDDGPYSPTKLFANILISFVGAGVLGLPYAFREAGIAQGTILMISVSVICIKAMLMLVDCKNHLVKMRVKEDEDESEAEKGRTSGTASPTQHSLDYGDVAQHVFGQVGWWTVQMSIVLSQIGFCCAYLIFITQNLTSLVGSFSMNAYLLACLLPQVALVMIRDLKGLGPFSLLADFANVFAYVVVFWFDFTHDPTDDGKEDKVVAFKPSGLAFFVGVAVYCFEGAGMVTALEESVPKKDRHNFPRVFVLALASITTLYVAFGGLGYLSFGEDTEKIITLNMPPGLLPDLVKSCLCVSLYFTFPVMMFPVSAILDKQFARMPDGSASSFRENVIRLCLVAASGLVVVAIPDFAHIMGLIGSTCCMLLALIFPGLLHLFIFKGSIGFWHRALDLFIIALGVVCMAMGTFDAVSRIVSASAEADEDMMV